MEITFKNTQISDYFLGKGDYTPVSELLYVHTHPLVQPNFVDELEGLVLLAGQIIEKKKLRGKPVEDLHKAAIAIGQIMPDLTKENAPKLLTEMRKVYTICSKLTGKQLP